jgi:phage tail sheath gpL-like
MVTTKFGRHKLVNDGTSVAAGQAVCTPSMIKSEIIALYKQWERLALVENTATFIANLVVERSLTDPTRVEVLYPPDLANGLMIFALLAQFRLAYSDAELAA